MCSATQPKENNLETKKSINTHVVLRANFNNRGRVLTGARGYTDRQWAKWFIQTVKHRLRIILENTFHHLLTIFTDSRHVRLATYSVFEEESDFQVKNKQFQSPGANNEEKLPAN